MARPLRIEFPNAIYHVMARGNGRQRIFHADADYQRMTDGLAKTIARTGWQVFAFVWMPNHIHLFVRTPKPNLSVGMQYLGERQGERYRMKRRVGWDQCPVQTTDRDIGPNLLLVVFNLLLAVSERRRSGNKGL